jgi:hypothetical protein
MIATEMNRMLVERLTNYWIGCDEIWAIPVWEFAARGR